MRYQKFSITTLLFCAGISGSPILLALDPPTPTISELTVTDKKLGTIFYALETLEYWTVKASAGDEKRAAKLHKDLLKQEQNLNAISGADPHQISQLQDYIVKLAEVLNQSAHRSTQKSTPEQTAETQLNSISQPTLDIKLYRGKVKKLKNRLNNPRAAGMELHAHLKELVAEIGQYGESQHKGYEILINELTDVANLIAERNPPINMTRTQALQFIENIDEKYQNLVPIIEFGNQRELTADMVDNFVRSLQELETSRQADLPTLQAITAATGEGHSALNRLVEGIPKLVNRSINKFEQGMQQHSQYIFSKLERLAKLDPKTNAYAFNNSEQRQVNEAQFILTSNSLAEAARLEAAFGTSTVYSDIKTQFDKNLDIWRTHFSAVVADYKLPVDIGSQKLRATAEKVLSTEKYGVGGWEKLIVNADLRDQETVDHKFNSSGIETIVRQWQEFQVTTVEVEEDSFYVYTNLIRNYSKAPRTTPLNRWILSKRIKGNQVDSNVLH